MSGERVGQGGRRGGAGRGRGAGRRGPGSRDRARGEARRARGSRPGRGAEGTDLEGVVREAARPRASGQTLVVEDRSGRSYRVECLGEPVEVGSRVAFGLLGGESSGRGVLLRVLEDARSGWVCRVRLRGGRYELLPYGGVEAPRFSLRERDAKSAREGDRVRVVPLESAGAGGRPARRRRRGARPTGGLPVRVAELLGPAGDPDADHRAVAWKYRLPERFSRRARLEVESIPSAADASALADRLDLRHLPFVTIDPASARDHDDALFAERAPRTELRIVDPAESDRAPSGSRGAGRRRPGGWDRRLWVAIADVSHFVEPGGWIDAEARRRGNSVYFPDRAIPMLPERLSGDLCSLREGVDRLAMVAELRLDAAGRVADALFHEAVIRSRATLSYERAAAWLEGRSDEEAAADEWGSSLRLLDEIAGELGRARREAGALLLELPETEIVVDETGRPVDARPVERNRAHALVEEAMLAANRAVAGALERAGRSTLHRGHAPPSPRRLESLVRLLDRAGVDAPEDLEEPGALAGILEEVAGLPSEERIHEAVLRAMSQARYEAESRGHYALRFEHYLHFTSPIRRYADLEVHRTLRRLLRGEPEPDPRRSGDARGAAEGERARAPAPDASASERLAVWLSGRERLAVEAEREATALAGCALMRGREGEGFVAQVTGVTEFGLFVRLERPCVSGLVPIRSLDGRWSVDEWQEALVGERSGARIALGASLRVRLAEVDPDRARLAFRIDEGRGGGDRRRGRR